MEVEAAIIYERGVSLPVSGQVFYILEKDPDDLLRRNDITSEIGFARTMNTLRNHAVTFFITDSQGQAEVKKLKTGTYHICGISHTRQEVVIWNVKVELNLGRNSLVLNNENMTRT